jgi:hypothetical protein
VEGDNTDYLESGTAQRVEGDNTDYLESGTAKRVEGDITDYLESGTAQRVEGDNTDYLESGTAQGEGRQPGVCDVKAEQLEVSQPGQARPHLARQVSVRGIEPQGLKHKSYAIWFSEFGVCNHFC